MEISLVSQDLKNALKLVFGNRLSKIILFGSYARNEQTEESDIDYLLVLKEDFINPFKELEKASPILLEFLLKYGKVFSLTVLSEKQLKNRTDAFGFLVKKEGIEVA